MLNFSFTSVFMAALTSNLLIIILSVIFLNRSIIYKFGLPLLSAFSILIILRMLMPFEFCNITTNIYMPSVISKALVFINHPLITIPLIEKTLSIWHIFIIIWIIGFLVLFSNYIYTIHKAYIFFSTFGTDVTKRPGYVQVIDRVCKNEKLKKQISVILLPFPQIPSVIRYHSHYYILIPKNLKLDNDEMELIFRHEISHILHHDMTAKFFLQILCYLYWWNPFCIILKKQIDMFFELRIDMSIISKGNGQAQCYMLCLLKVAKYYNNHLKETLKLLSGIRLIPINSSTINKRFAYITKEKEERNKPLCNFVLISACAIYILSFIFIFEGYYMYPEHISEGEMFMNSENTFIVKNKDNTYDIYFNGKFCETVDSLELEYYPEDCKIYPSIEEAIKNEKE